MNTRMEKYRNHILPIDDIVYAEYKPKTDLYQRHGFGTFVYIHVGPAAMLQSVLISKDNVLDNFKEWLDQFPKYTPWKIDDFISGTPMPLANENGLVSSSHPWTETPPNLSECPPVKIPDKLPGGYPRETYLTRTDTTSDGKSHTVVLNGPTSESEEL